MLFDTVDSFDPQAPITRKGVLTSFRTGRPMEIKEDDIVRLWLID